MQAGRAAMERLGLSSDMAAATAAAGHRELRDGGGRHFPDAATALGAFRANASARFFPGTSDIAATVAAIRANDPHAPSRTIDLALASAAGRYRVLGYPALDYGTPPDWHFDPVNGRRSPLAHWSRIPFLDESVVGDHKVIWELNRHQWLLHLAKAYHFSGDERWAEQAFGHIDAWIAANPNKQGINWVSSLEISFRGIAWLWVLYMLRDASALTAERFARIVRVLAVGGRHIEHHLSTWFAPNTHLTGEALGLLYLGCALPELNDAARWRGLGTAILAERMPQHVRSDGSYIEQSTHYARYTVDFLIHAITLSRRAGIHVPAQLTSALQRGATFLRHIGRPDGTIPLIGDDDGGRLLFLDPAPADDVRPTLAAAAAITGDATMDYVAGAPTEELAWLLGPAALRTAPARTPGPAAKSRLFADGGFAALRDGWDRDASLAVFDCGQHGMGNGGHAHADLGSIDMTIRGHLVVADPGTWTYLPGGGGRDRFREAAAHAVPMVDGQGSSEPGAAFSWVRSARVIARSDYLSSELDVVAFSHDGFQHLQDPVAHRRALVRARRDYWLIVDGFRSARSHNVAISYPLASGLRTMAERNCAMIADARSELARFATADPEGRWLVADAWTSNAYGHREPAARLIQEMSFSGNLLVATLVQPPEHAIALSSNSEKDGTTQLVIERAPGMCDVFRFGEQSCSFVDSGGRRIEWAWPPLAVVASKSELN